MKYHDFEIEVTDAAMTSAPGKRTGSFRVRVLDSPYGGMQPDQAMPVEYDDKALQSSLARLDRRELDREGLIGLGQTLALLLLPAASEPQRGVRELLASSLARIGDEGLRLRLRLPPSLAGIPWEYAYVAQSGGDGMDGFLALDPRIAFVRHEVLTSPVAVPALEGDIRVVAAVASPPDLEDLDVELEMEILEKALENVPGLKLEACGNATLQALQSLLVRDAGVFHFAGHGAFKRASAEKPGTYEGKGSLAFEDELVDGETFGINLRGRGVRLAVLAGCSTGRREGRSTWSAVASALVKTGIPAVVANQYTILDRSAIAFSRAFYQAIAGGLPLERAVADGRIAVFNSDEEGGRDWGVPVLYLRAGDGELFRGAARTADRSKARDAAEVHAKVRAGSVKAGGIVVGAELGELLAGLVVADVKVRDVSGTVIGVKAGEVSSGNVSVEVDAGDVGPGGSVRGVVLGRGGRAADMAEASVPASLPKRSKKKSSKKKSSTRSAPPSSAPPPPRSRNGGTSERRSRSAPTTTSTVNAGTIHGGEVIGSQFNAPVTIIQGERQDDDDDQIVEKIRLDAAFPKTAVVDDPFPVVVAVKQPESEVLSVPEAEQVVSEPGEVFFDADDAVVSYRIEVSGDQCEVRPPSIKVKLRRGQDSRPARFQVIARKPGARSLVVVAYQEDDALAAQTEIKIEAKVRVEP